MGDDAPPVAKDEAARQADRAATPRGVCCAPACVWGVMILRRPPYCARRVRRLPRTSKILPHAPPLPNAAGVRARAPASTGGGGCARARAPLCARRRRHCCCALMSGVQILM